tara:strand:+ start:296 stop:775 length:480 start_codon:yes stop_codon:yes gene_type:complete
MIYDALEFPLFVVHTDNVEQIDGILWVEDQVLDDTNMKGDTIGIRRLKSPMKSMYPLKYMVDDIPSLLNHQGKHYIDNSGFFFTKEKKHKVDLKYHKILRVEKKTIASTLWIKDCPFPFTLKRPLPENASWAGVLHRAGIPWILYEVSEEKKKDTWRKV